MMPYVARIVRILFLPLLLLAGAASCTRPSPGPQARQGHLDLAGYDFARSGPLEIVGDFRFQWRPHGRPLVDGFLAVPASWNGRRLQGQALPSFGRGIYSLDVGLTGTEAPLAIRVKSVATAYRLRVNGRELAHRGRPGQSAATTQPRFLPVLAEIPPDLLREGKLGIEIEVANFHHASGGLWNKPVIGLREDLMRLVQRNLALELGMAGLLFGLALYHAIVFTLFRSQYAAGFLGLFCLGMGLRTVLMGERFAVVLLPALDWFVAQKLENAMAIVALLAYMLFLREMFRGQFWAWAIWPIGVAAGGFIAAIAILSVHGYAKALPFTYCFVMGCGLFAIAVLVRALIARAPGATAFGIAVLILFAAGLNDVLNAMEVIYAPYVTSYAMGGFALAQSFMLARKFSAADRSLRRARIDLVRQNTEISELNGQRERIFQDLHDNLGGRLTDMYLIARDAGAGSDSSVARTSPVGQIASRLSDAMTVLRDRLQSFEDQKLLLDDVAAGLRTIILRRYVAQDRRVRFEDSKSLSGRGLLIPDDRLRRDVHAVVNEIVTNDLKYGAGDSIWRFRLEPTWLELSLLAQTTDSKTEAAPGGPGGRGCANMEARMTPFGGELMEFRSEDSIQVRVRLPRHLTQLS